MSDIMVFSLQRGWKIASFTLGLLILLMSSVTEAQRVLQSTFGNKKTYEFGYTVDRPRFKNDFGHYESKRLDGVVRGQYHVLLPDGRVQLVIYYADDTGYHPTITYLSLNDWNLIKSGRLALPLLRNRLRQNVPFDPRASGTLGSNPANGNRRPNSLLRNGPSTPSPFGINDNDQRQPFGSNGGIRRQPASLLRNRPSDSTRSPFVTTQGPSRFSGRASTISPSTRFPARSPFSSERSTTPFSSGIRPSFPNSGSRNQSPFLTTRGSLPGNNNNGNIRENDSIFESGNSRFRPSTTSPFRRNVVVRNKNSPSDSTPVYFDNSV